MSQRVQRFRLRSLTGLFMVAAFSLIVWLAIAYGVAQVQHGGRASCTSGDHAQSSCKADN